MALVRDDQCEQSARRTGAGVAGPWCRAKELSVLGGRMPRKSVGGLVLGQQGDPSVAVSLATCPELSELGLRSHPQDSPGMSVSQGRGQDLCHCSQDGCRLPCSPGPSAPVTAAPLLGPRVGSWKRVTAVPPGWADLPGGPRALQGGWCGGASALGATPPSLACPPVLSCKSCGSLCFQEAEDGN